MASTPFAFWSSRAGLTRICWTRRSKTSLSTSAACSRTLMKMPCGVTLTRSWIATWSAIRPCLPRRVAGQARSSTTSTASPGRSSSLRASQLRQRLTFLASSTTSSTAMARTGGSWWSGSSGPSTNPRSQRPHGHGLRMTTTTQRLLPHMRCRLATSRLFTRLPTSGSSGPATRSFPSSPGPRISSKKTGESQANGVRSRASLARAREGEYV
mmetsp:Transcript_16272/g.46190  ORF Transcript_16272/g.46190 Transcript_16272/m.46190 type:complete len:212 (+) Transcript_16272:592-1227(+)